MFDELAEVKYLKEMKGLKSLKVKEEAYLEPEQASMMKFFVKIVNDVLLSPKKLHHRYSRRFLKKTSQNNEIFTTKLRWIKSSWLLQRVVFLVLSASSVDKCLLFFVQFIRFVQWDTINALIGLVFGNDVLTKVLTILWKIEIWFCIASHTCHNIFAPLLGVIVKFWF